MHYLVIREGFPSGMICTFGVASSEGMALRYMLQFATKYHSSNPTTKMVAQTNILTFYEDVHQNIGVRFKIIPIKYLN